jgi:putative ABC transport system permease protein
MSTAGVVQIGWLELVLATGFVLLTGALSLALGLGLTKDLGIATARTYAQLLALGFVLRWVFGVNQWWLVIGLLLLMSGMAARIILKRAPDAPKGLWSASFFSMVVTGFIVTFAVTALIVRVQPWWEARYVIPIGGMVLGNSMTGIALALERVFADLDARREELLALTALGASVPEAGHASVVTAIRAGLIPTIASMAAVGIVFIPGMMTGQILAGADPLEASKYQIVVMLMVASATAVGSILAVLLSYRRRFSAEGVYLERGHRA